MIKFEYIHNNKQYTNELVKILNSQWPRSEYSRVISIERSNDNLPLYLIMIKSEEMLDENDNKFTYEELIGCLSISNVLNNDKTVLIENVLIKPIYRGKGYGKMVMNEAHKIIKEKQYCVSYLSTHDKRDFYKTLGYQDCEPLITSSFSSNNSNINNNQNNINNSSNNNNININNNQFDSINNNNNNNDNNNDKYNNDKDDSEKVSNLLKIFGGGGSKKIKQEDTIYWMKLNLEL